MSTEFYMPKPKEIENPKQLASEIAKKIISEVKSDTLFLIVDNPSLICGSEGRNSRSKFLQKVDDLKYAIKTEYYFQKLESFEPFYKNEDRVIITGRSSTGPEGCGCFRSVIANFESEAIKNKLVYEVNYTSISKNKVAVLITDFNTNQEISSLNLALENNKWSPI